MALSMRTHPRRQAGRHGAQTPLLRQLGFGRRHGQDAGPAPTATAAAPVAEAQPLTPEEQARAVVARLFPTSETFPSSGLYPLSWECGHGRAAGRVDPDLVPDIARNVVLAYASSLGAAFEQQDADGRLTLRVSRSLDGVQVTVWADVTPQPQTEVTAAPVKPVGRVEAQPIERLAHAAIDDTQVFPAITAEDGWPDAETAVPVDTSSTPPPQSEANKEEITCG